MFFRAILTLCISIACTTTICAQVGGRTYIATSSAARDSSHLRSSKGDSSSRFQVRSTPKSAVASVAATPQPPANNTASSNDAAHRTMERGAKRYPDSHGNSIYFPLGDISFADEVVQYRVGDPSPRESIRLPARALGAPNYALKEYNPDDPQFTTLGCGGSTVLRFVDNALVDVPGPDLFIFEIGYDVEATDLAISKDGSAWIHVGTISGATAMIDIAEYVKPGDVYHYVRLFDLRTGCDFDLPGADIDAVGAIGSAVQISLNSSVLFDYGTAELKAEAKKALHDAAMQIKQYPGARVAIEGHTDNVGSADYNQKLSEERAAAVRRYLASIQGLNGALMESHGYGKTRPIDNNDTEAGRERNRRVDIVVMPAK